MTPTVQRLEALRQGVTRADERLGRMSLFRGLERAADRVGQFFGREGFVQEASTAFKDPTLSQ